MNQMRKYYVVIFLMFFYSGVYTAAGHSVKADNPMAKELTINQIKITGDEFIILHNATPRNVNLGNYWLEYFNDFNLANQGISNTSQQLPTVILQPDQEILLAVGTAASCGPVWFSKLSFSFKDSAGLLQIVGISQNSGLVSYKTQDQVSWSSKTADPVDIGGVSSSSASQIWYRNASGWQSSSLPIGCSAVGGMSASTGTPSTLTKLNSSPPSIALGDPSSEVQSSTNNPGLAAPQVSEILPNPGAPQADATDEFIELYNPNNEAFDLSGFALRTGNSSFHTYSFTDGQFILQPHEFRAFYAPQTGITLSNSGGQAALLDPGGNVATQSDEYGTAKDNYAWVLSGNVWQWTTTVTPNSQNIISAPTSSVKATKTKKAAVSKKSSKTVKSAAFKTTANGSAPFSSQPGQQSSLHPLVLATVGIAALLYACYEYRHDIANQFYRARRNRRTGPQAGQVA